MSVRGLGLTSALLAAVGVLGVAGKQTVAFWAWACLAVALGLAMAILVVQAAPDPLLPRKLLLLVLVAPLFAGSYGLGRMLWGKAVSLEQLLELTGLWFLLFGALAVAFLMLRKTSARPS